MKCPSCSAEGPDGAAECAACGVIFAKLKAKAEKAAAAPAPAPAPAPAASGLGGTVVILACLCAVVYGGYRVYESRVSPAPEKPKGALINPESFKADIQALEKAVYEGTGSVQEVAATAEAAANRIVEGVLSKRGRNPLVQDAAADVMDFATRMAAAQESLGAPPTARLEFVRAWETVRAKRFAPADWYHPPEAVKPGEPPDFEKAAQRILNAAMNLRALMASLPAELDQFGERAVQLRGAAEDDLEHPPPAEDVPGQWDAMEKAAKAERAAAAAGRESEDQKRLEAWRAWVPQWRARVDGVLADFPKPEEIPDELEHPYETLVRASQAASSPPDPGAGAFLMASEPAAKALYLPSKYSRDAWCQNVTNWLSGLPDNINAIREAKKNPRKPESAFQQ